MRGSEHVVIVGCGVIGANAAYYLQRAGYRVTMIDQAGFGSGASHGNCGIVSPSYAMPLAQPGLLKKMLHDLLSADSPVKINLFAGPSLWWWLLKFQGRCRLDAMIESTHVRHELLQSSRELYDDLFANEPLHGEWEAPGGLYVCRTPESMAAMAKIDHFLAEQVNLPAVRYDGDAMLELEPALKPGLAGGWLYPGEGQLRPDVLMASWKTLLADRGVTILEHQKVTGFVVEQGRARAVQTAQGDLPADQVVVATGAWTPFLNTELGCSIPIQPGKGYSLTMHRPSHCPKIALHFSEDKVVATPHQSAYRLGSVMELVGYDSTIDPRRIQYLKDRAARYMHEPVGEPEIERWTGWRPMIYDDRPIIDFSPRLSNVLIAAGHAMLGLSMAPATGKLVAEMLTDETPHIDVEPFGLARFGIRVPKRRPALTPR